jgi:hypothetical protein
LMNGSERQFSSTLRDSAVLAEDDLVYDIDIGIDATNDDVGI